MSNVDNIVYNVSDAITDILEERFSQYKFNGRLTAKDLPFAYNSDEQRVYSSPRYREIIFDKVNENFVEYDIKITSGQYYDAVQTPLKKRGVVITVKKFGFLLVSLVVSSIILFHGKQQPMHNKWSSSPHPLSATNDLRFAQSTVPENKGICEF